MEFFLHGSHTRPQIHKFGLVFDVDLFSDSLNDSQEVLSLFLALILQNFGLVWVALEHVEWITKVEGVTFFFKFIF